MADAADVVGRLIFGSLIAVYLAHGYSASKARARKAAGIGHLSCGQCGEALPPLPDQKPNRLCAACLRRTQRNYMAGARFFGGLALLFMAMAPVIAILEYRRFGVASASRALVAIVPMAVVVGAAAWAIRYAARKLE